MGKKKNKEKGNSIWKKKLALQIAATITVVALVILMAQTGFAMLSFKYVLSKRVRAEFTEIADNNGNMVQHMLQTAELSNKYVENYHNTYYQNFSKSTNGQGGQSRFYKVPLTRGEFTAENYYVDLMGATIANNSFFDGMGIYFEPYSFDKKIENYSFYVYRGADFNPEHPQMEYTSGEDYRQQDWYTEAVQTGMPVVSAPYEEDGNVLISISSPLKYEGKVVGVTLVDLYTAEFADIKSTNADYRSMSAGVINGNCEYMYNSSSAALSGHPVSEGFADPNQFAVLKQKMQQGEDFVYDVKTPNGTYSTYYNAVQFLGQTWWSYTGVLQSDMMKAVDQIVMIMSAVSFASLVILAALSSTMIVKKLKPLKQLNEAADSLLRGDLKYDITYSSEDEIGQACANIKEAFQSLRNIIDELSRWMKALENCDLTVVPQMEFQGDFVAIQTAYTSLIENLNNSFQEIKVSADQINIGAEQISGAAQTLSQGSAEQAASVEELSAMITDVTDKIKSNASDASEANNLSQRVGEDVKQSSQYMNDLMEAMERITASSNEVNKIIKTIDDIAFQTNILALNAAVEAARAGSAGKGFAVVADEVRNLAGKSADAAKSTTALIESEISAVAEGTNIANMTAESLKQVVSNVQAITAKVQEINVSSEQQTTSVDQINTGATQISAVIQANSATSEESAAASEELAGQANMLDSLVKQFKLKEDGEN